MINLKVSVDAAKALPLQTRVVECVTKSSSLHPTFGKITCWRGALKDEYFYIVFIGGVVVVSVAECEFQLGQISVNYAESESLLKSAEIIKAADKEFKQQLQSDYTNIIAKQEQDEITFDDVMIILDWRYADLARVDESDLFGV